MARHQWISTCTLLFCFFAWALPIAHAHEHLQHIPQWGGDGTTDFDTSNSEVSSTGRDFQLSLERQKRSAFDNENFWDERRNVFDLSADESRRYENFVRVRRSVGDDDDYVFTADESEDSIFQESNRDERSFFDDGLENQDSGNGKSKRSVDDGTRPRSANQESDDDFGSSDADDTSDSVFKRFRRNVDERNQFGDEERSDDDEEEDEEEDSIFRRKRNVNNWNEIFEDGNEDYFLSKARTASRFRRSLTRDRSDEIDSAEDEKEDDTSSEERIKRSTGDDDGDNNEDKIKLERYIDTKDLFSSFFNPKNNIRIKRESSYSEPASDTNDENQMPSSEAHYRQKRSLVFEQRQNYHSFDSEVDQKKLNKLGETHELRTRVRRSAKDKKQSTGGAHQVSSYTAYELKPAATSHKGKSGSGGGSSGHKASFSAASGHKSGEGHKAGKGFSVDTKGSHDKKGASGHKEAGGKNYKGGEHKSHSYKHGDSGKKGSKSHSKGHSAHKSKGQKQGGFKNKKAKDESGGSKSFYDKSDHKGYHSKYDHYDSFHVSSEGGESEKGSHASKKTHDVHGVTGHKEGGKHHDDKAVHKAEHGSKGGHEHKKTTGEKASHDSKHKAKH